jgi:spermidine/putrescine transport system substrate-binding protein
MSISRNIKKHVRRIMLGVFLLIQTSVCMAVDRQVLNVYTWSDFLPDSVIKQFEHETSIQINHSTYMSNEVLYAKLKTNMGEGYDVIMPSAYFINRMVSQNLLQRIDTSKLKNFKYLNPEFLSREHDPENAYCLPFLWSSSGIVVNTKYHDKKNVSSWADFWNEKYKNDLLLIDDVREIFSIALLVLGDSVNDSDPQHIKAAFEKLKALMPNIKLFNTDTMRSIYIDEDVTIGMGWSGDMFLAQNENPNLAFIYPKEGFVVSLDCLAIPKKSRNIANAHRFIDFLSRPEIGKQIAMETGFATTNLKTVGLLPEAMRQSPILYPDKETMKRGHLQLDVGDAASLYEQYFERLKLGD